MTRDKLMDNIEELYRLLAEAKIEQKPDIAVCTFCGQPLIYHDDPIWLCSLPPIHKP